MQPQDTCVALGTDYQGSCLGQVDATGGLVSITWTRVQDWANLGTSSSKSYQLGKLVAADSYMSGTFSAGQAGTVLGVNAANSEYAVMGTSTDSQSLKDKFQVRKLSKVGAR